MMNDSQFHALQSLLTRIADTLERNAGTGDVFKPADWGESTAWLWQSNNMALKAVYSMDSLPLDLLIGVDSQAKTLLNNTTQFAKGYAANNALLWGAQGTGKSSLIKAIHNKLDDDPTLPLHIIEIYREDLGTLTSLLDILRSEPEIRFVLYCDDLSFNENDSSYKSLKAVLDGGIEGRPDNVVIYATHKSKDMKEKASLASRFGLWLSFYKVDQKAYLKIVKGYAKHYKLKFKEKEALEWAVTRGNRSGRVAYQFIQHIAGQQGKNL